jgi:hypothetical protein
MFQPAVDAVTGRCCRTCDDERATSAASRLRKDGFVCLIDGDLRIFSI